MGKTYITHAWMPYREDHIAWSVIRSFAYLWKKATGDEVYIVDPTRTDGDFKDTKGSTVIVFATQKMLPVVKHAAYRADRLLAVFEDPNWQVEFCPQKPYEMVTWFKTLDGYDPFQAFHTVKEMTGKKYDIAVPIGNLYLPLTSALLEDPEHLARYSNAEFKQKIKSPSGVAYAGSLKADRKEELAELAMTGCDFYGNFDLDKLCRTIRLDKKKVSKDTRCMGHVSPFVVPKLYEQYDEVAYIPDESTILLDTDTLRLAELAMANCRVRAITSDKRLEPRMKERLSMVCDWKGNASWNRFHRNRDTIGFVNRLKHYNKVMAEKDFTL